MSPKKNFARGGLRQKLKIVFKNQFPDFFSKCPKKAKEIVWAPYGASLYFFFQILLCIKVNY